MAGTSTTDRGSWNSKLGFILAAAGSAVGLGNIWAFPTKEILSHKDVKQKYENGVLSFKIKTT